MAFETTICEECPTPIQWQQLRKHYLFLINTALDVRDQHLKERDESIRLLAEFAHSVIDFMLAEDEEMSVKQYKKKAARVKRTAKAMRANVGVHHSMHRAKEAFHNAVLSEAVRKAGG